ncbi:MAG: trypsin-like peptidase domain-containing protein [Thermoguttaceae bacterium]|nr:trypsin-like peptidase domain-containing protein [Thermoguttaceae bacterium]
MNRIVRRRLLLALALGLSATSTLSVSFAPSRFTTPPNAASRRLSETAFGSAPLPNRFLDAPPFDDFLGASVCPNGSCSLDFGTPTPSFQPAPQGAVRAVARIYNAYEETTTLDPALGPTRRKIVEKGSGAFVADSHGTRYVLTAAHIFRDGRGQISAQSVDGRVFSASLVLASEECDVALLRVDLPADVPTLTVSASWPRQGETVWRAGFGPDETLKELSGTVKGYVKTDRCSTYETLKIDGPARQGDSGGPVYNADGEIVGVVWGTDGQDAYATYCGRVLKTLCDYSPTFDPDASLPEPPTLPDPPIPSQLADSQPIKNDPFAVEEPPLAPVESVESKTLLADFCNAAVALTVGFAFGYCGFFASKRV